MVDKFAIKVLLAIACCFVLVLLPVSTAAAQDVLKGAKEGIEKGAQGVKKGGEVVVDKTEDVGEAVGKGAKDLVTDDDDDNINQDDTTTDRMKPTETQSGTTSQGTTSSEATSETSTSAGQSESVEGDLPATAGEMPLLALFGAIALATAAALKMVRRQKSN
jgi:hypothetical protein